jgi:uncharacterized protein DUF2867
MRVHEVDPNVDSDALLAGAQFADAYSIAIDGAALDARQAAEKMLARAPLWIEVLLALRNLLVTPLGLKTSAPDEPGGRDIIGYFRSCAKRPIALLRALTTSTWIFASWSMSQAPAIPSASPRPRWY